MLEPVKLRPVRKEKIWGYEDWVLSMLPGEESVIDGGKYDGMKLGDYINLDRRGFLGSFCDAERFPFLIKEIVAREGLSAQVHPSDEILPGRGKSEMWYIIGAKPGAELIAGLTPGTDTAKLRKAGSEGIMPMLSRIGVAPGDAVNIPAGLVHAIGGGIRLLEVQQSSDVTYRMYDFDRGRELHWEESMAAINTNVSSEIVSEPVGEGVRFTNELFDLCVFEAGTKIYSPNFGESFFCVYCIEGSAKLIFEKSFGGESFALSVEKGRSIAIPAGFGLVAQGDCGELSKKDTKKVLTIEGGRANIAFVAPRERKHSKQGATQQEKYV